MKTTGWGGLDNGRGGVPILVELAGEGNNFVEFARFLVEISGAQIARCLQSVGIDVAGVDDYRKPLEFRCITNEFQNGEAAVFVIDEVDEHEINPSNVVFCARSDEAVQVGDGPLNGIYNMPLDRNAVFFCGGLKENLIIGAVVDVKGSGQRVPVLARCSRSIG